MNQETPLPRQRLRQWNPEDFDAAVVFWWLAMSPTLSRSLKQAKMSAQLIFPSLGVYILMRTPVATQRDVFFPFKVLASAPEDSEERAWCAARVILDRVYSGARIQNMEARKARKAREHATNMPGCRDVRAGHIVLKALEFIKLLVDWVCSPMDDS